MLLRESVFCSFFSLLPGIPFGEGNGTPLQHSCLENPMDGGAWWAIVHGVAKSWTRLRYFTFTFHFSLSCIGEGNGNPFQCSCLENPGDRGAWWAAIYGVSQSWTRLMLLSSSSSSSIPLYEHITVYFSSPFIFWSVDIWVVSSLGFLEVKPLTHGLREGTGFHFTHWHTSTWIPFYGLVSIENGGFQRGRGRGEEGAGGGG